MLFTTSDLAVYLRIGTDALNGALAELLRELAQGEIENVIGTVEDPAPVRVKNVALEMTARAYRNPKGLSQVRIDDYAHTIDAAAAGVYLTAAERSRLSDSGTGRISSKRLSAYGDLQ